jgi:Cdc6-like AAA superfamily ATPase
LDSLRIGNRAENAFIHGPSGAGKTTLAKHTLDLLRRDSMQFTWGYVNCISDSTESAVLYELVRDAKRGADLRREGTKASTLTARLRDLEEPFVAVVDEVDALSDPSMLATLYETAGVSFILITVEADPVMARLDERIRSRVATAAECQLDKYSHDELVDILQARARAGLRDGAVTEPALGRMANIAAGDARMAIALLRRAARTARNDRLTEISANLVASVTDEAHQAVRERHVRTLGTHNRLLYEIISEAGTIQASDLHDAYEHRAEDPKSKRMRRQYLESLERYDLIQQVGTGRGTRYEALT